MGQKLIPKYKLLRGGFFMSLLVVEEPTVEAKLREQAVGDGVGIFKVRTLRDAVAEIATAPPWVIQDLLLRDSASLLSAHPHSMKSLSLLCACIEAVAVKQVWGHFAASSVERSLFIETEDPPWMVEGRIRGLAGGLNVGNDLEGFYYACVGAFDLVQMEDQITELLARYHPDFAVLSTLQGLLGGRDWLRQSEMADVNALIVKLSRICPLIVVTHSPWDKKSRRPAGTITQAANYATSIHYAKTSGTQVHVTVDSKAGAVETSFGLRLQCDGDPREADTVRAVTYAGKGWPKGQAKGAVLEALEDDPAASSQEIADRVGSGLRNVQKIRKKLREENQFATKCAALED